MNNEAFLESATVLHLIKNEVRIELSSCVATLAQGYRPDAHSMGSHVSYMMDIAEQAVELAAPIPDYEQAARDAGWIANTGVDLIEGFNTPSGGVVHLEEKTHCASWERACELDDIEPYDLEVFEHWAVSNWLADQLEAHGEKVDRDFLGLSVWARTETGPLASDPTIVKIAKSYPAWSPELPALMAAEDFISGFEDDELQEGVPELLEKLRAAIYPNRSTDAGKAS